MPHTRLQSAPSFTAPIRNNVFNFPAGVGIKLKKFIMDNDSMRPEIEPGQTVFYDCGDAAQLPPGCIAVIESIKHGVCTAGRASAVFRSGICMIRVEFANADYPDLLMPFADVNIRGVVIL